MTATTEDGPVGVAIGSFASISLDPPLVGFFLGNDSTSGQAIREAGHFCVNVLTKDQLELCGIMASKAPDKFDGVAVTAGTSGAPLLPDVHAVIDCTLHSVVSLGDHDLIVGSVVHLAATEEEEHGAPMVFYKGRYGTFG